MYSAEFKKDKLKEFISDNKSYRYMTMFKVYSDVPDIYHSYMFKTKNQKYFELCQLLNRYAFHYKIKNNNYSKSKHTFIIEITEYF